MNTHAQARAESRRRIDASKAQVDAALAKSMRLRKQHKNPFWILLPVIGGIALTGLMACLAQLLM
ncbi:MULTISPECIES: hypothetical protein [unclassified Pseudomonas]|uniref:hypothetical protein n=1 Tax=unclassified Pseudomonas TaxID=196821 RepID=UPI00131C3437|nr:MULTISPECIES: hypothetical protein [unclassified Pseudomonas]